MAEAVVSYAIKLLAEEALQGPLRKKEELEGNLRRIQTFLHNAQWRQVEEEAVWEWVEKLEDIAYEVEEVIREQRSRNLRRREWIARVSCFIPPISSFLNEVAAKREISLKMEEIGAKIQSTLREGEVFGFDRASNAIPERFKRPKTVPFLDQKLLFGRERNISVMVEFLVDTGIQAVCMWGFGGSGKTTLAQVVFNHDRVKAFFDTRIWVHVSNIVDENKICEEILDFLGVHSSENEEESLFQLVEKCFSGKKVLLVLDDVWSEGLGILLALQKSLESGAPGSNMLVTTRSRRVTGAGEFSYNVMHVLGPLPNSDCWLILKSIALSERQGGKELIKVGKKIAKNCKGSPLVAHIVGGLLRSKQTVQEWQQVLDSEIWEMEEIGMSLFSNLYWTYEELSPEMRPCLCYCAIFPKNTAINVDQLVRLWVAQGYFGYSTQEDGDDLDKGMKCFRELTSRSFFEDLTQDSMSIHRNKLTSCKIQGSAHDFVKYMGRRDFARLSRRMPSGSTVFSSHKKVRSVVLPLDIPVDAYLFSQLKRVRALVLSSRELDELPSEVGELSRLQYMDLSDNPIKELPETICKLFFLEFLDVHFCYLLSSLPQQFHELERMKHLRLNNTTDELQILPRGFEKLRLIQTLDVFQVGGKFEGNIVKLRHLDHLQEVSFVVHGRVHFADARLEEKTEMKNLEFSFSWSGRYEEVATSIQKLQPPPNLEMLMFEDYPGDKLPRWILTEPLVSKLTRLSLKSASEITSLPGLWRLSSLEFLWLYDIPNLSHLGHEFFGFPDPQKQHSEKLKGRKRYEDDDVVDDIDSEGSDHQDGEASDGELNEVHVYRFHRLKTWRMEHLENFEGWNIGWNIEFDMELDNKPLLMPSLEELIINKCPKLKLQQPRFQNLAIIDKESTPSYM